MMYNAFTEGSPVVLMAGQQDQRLRLAEPVLAGDMVSVARPWTKWAHEVQRVEDIPAATRRALQVALTPPTGPVFLALPVDLQREVPEGVELDPSNLAGPSLAEKGTRPPLEALRRAAELLVAAERPAILAGGRAVEAGAIEEVTRLAELLGAPVLTESTASQGRRPMAADHPLYAGPISMWAPEVSERLGQYDLVLAVGADLVKLYIHREPECPWPEGLTAIHMDLTPSAIGRNHPVEVGLVGDPKAGLAELAELVGERLGPQLRARSTARTEEEASRRRAARAELQAELDAARDRDPMPLIAFAEALCRPLPDDVVVVEEAITTHHSLLAKLGVPRDPEAYIAHRGWALGWGLGCSLGVQLAWPERPVVALLGDGSALFGVQGLWTAAHYRLPVTFVVSNNAQYGILKMGGKVMGLPRMSAGQHVGIDLVDPEVDFVSLARSFGVEAVRVEKPGEVEEEMAAALASAGPTLIDAAIDREG
jgi:benzoylformate decarboxylase